MTVRKILLTALFIIGTTLSYGANVTQTNVTTFTQPLTVSNIVTATGGFLGNGSGLTNLSIPKTNRFDRITIGTSVLSNAQVFRVTGTNGPVSSLPARPGFTNFATVVFDNNAQMNIEFVTPGAGMNANLVWTTNGQTSGTMAFITANTLTTSLVFSVNSLDRLTINNNGVMYGDGGGLSNLTYWTYRPDNTITGDFYHTANEFSHANTAAVWILPDYVPQSAREVLMRGSAMADAAPKKFLFYDLTNTTYGSGGFKIITTTSHGLLTQVANQFVIAPEFSVKINRFNNTNVLFYISDLTGTDNVTRFSNFFIIGWR